MKIGYKQSQLNLSIYLILGILWLIIGLLGLIVKEHPFWTDYAFIGLSISYFILHFFQKRYGYLIIENGMIKESWFFGKNISLVEIHTIKEIGAEMILKSNTKEMKIKLGSLDQESIGKLKAELKKLNVHWV